MFEELGISTFDSVLAAFNAICDLKEETERLQAAFAAKEAELYELRSRTAELFGERLSAEGADDDAVQAAKAMWLSEPAAAAHAALGCDIVEAANPWGCNQYGHRKGHSGGVGGTDAKNRESRSNLSDSDADFLTSDAYEIAMEEGGYEILYDTPKEKVKKAIRDTLKETGSASMLEGDTSALYSWWKKNKEKVVNKLKEDSLQASNKHACEQESELYSAEYYDALECSHTLEEMLDADVLDAANPYGCNQYGHEWKGKHGEGWKPSGRGGKEKQGEKGGSDEKKISPQRRPDGSFNVPSIGKTLAIPTPNQGEKRSPIYKPKDMSDKDFREALDLDNPRRNKGEKTAEEEADEYEKGTDDDRWVTLRKWKRERQEAKDKALDIRDSSKYRQKDPEAIKAYEKAKDEANRRAKRIHEIIKIVAKRRGLSQRATDHMLRLYPETIIDF